MTKKFSMADLTSALLSAELGQPAICAQNADAPNANQLNHKVKTVGLVQHAPSEVVSICDNIPSSDAPIRRRPVSGVGISNSQPSARQQQRDARAYAESWWQALREWETRSNGGILVLGERGHNGSGRQMVPVVGNWQSTPYGIHRFNQVNTPIGWISETALSLACSAGEVLSKLRAGGGRATLMHSNGRGWDGKEALGYGVQVLGLAVRLGDQTAIHHLELLNVGKNATLFLELPQE